MAPEDGNGIAELIRLTGMTRATLYRHLGEHARHGHAVQVSWGHWRAAPPTSLTMSDCLKLSHLPPARVLHVNARTSALRQTTRRTRSVTPAPPGHAAQR